jgi:hypothetical protein
MIGEGGAETNDPDEATAIVAQLPDGRWLAHDCRPGEIVAITICFH